VGTCYCPLYHFRVSSYYPADTRVIPVLIKWLATQKLTFKDPMGLSQIKADFDWTKITEDQFNQWAKDTDYAGVFQAIGSKQLF